jgi:hypothetical protein
MKNSELELYTDYLLSSFGATTTTGLSAMVRGDVSHDRITRFLSRQDYTSKNLWLQVKKMVREVQTAEGVLIFDDTIQEKAWTSASSRGNRPHSRKKVSRMAKPRRFACFLVNTSSRSAGTNAHGPPIASLPAMALRAWAV